MTKVKLKEIVDICNGSTPSTLNEDFFNGDIAWLTPKDLSDQKSKYIFRGERNITELGLKSIGNKLLPIGTILFSSRAPIGLMSIAKAEVSTNQGFKNMVCKKNKILAEYLFYLLKTKISYIQELGTGTTFKEVSKKTLDDFELYIEEDIKSQHKIAAVLSALDDKIELNNQINAELEAMAKTLYDYWFVQFDFPNAEGKPYKSSRGKMVYNKVLKREIPEGWEVKNIFDVAKVQYGFPFSTQFFNADEVGIPVIRIRDILENSTSNYSSEKNVDEKYLINKGDLLIGMDGNFHINYWSKNGCYLNQRVVMIKEKNIPNMLVRYQIEPYIKLREKSVSRTTVGHLSDKDLKRLNIIIPTNEFVEKSKKFFDQALQKIVSNQNQNQELAQLRDWLLPMLMNGQVTVGEVEEKLGMVAEEKSTYLKTNIQ